MGRADQLTAFTAMVSTLPTPPDCTWYLSTLRA